MPYTLTTWSELRERLKDKYEGVPFWDPSEALAAVNEGLAVYNLFTGYWKRRETLVTVANQVLYTLSPSMLYRMRVEFNGLPLSPSNREDLNNGRQQWRADTTTTGGVVPTRPMLWAPISLGSFYIWPADAAGGNTLTIDGVAVAPLLVRDGDFIDLGPEQINTLLGYALHTLAFKQGGPFFAASQPLLKAFIAACAEENAEIRTSQAYRRVMGLDFARSLQPLRQEPLQDPLTIGENVA